MKKFYSFLLAMFLVLSFAACGSSNGSYDSGYYTETATEAYAPSAPMEGFYDEAMYEESYESKDMTVAENANSTNRKLIKTYGLDIETEDFSSLMSSLQERVVSLGGYVENLDTYNGSKYYYSTKYSNLTVRIPADRAEEFINYVGESSNITNQSLNVNDVTLTYVDMKSEKDAYLIEQERLLALLEKAETIEDMITIESRLSTVRYSIETMESQLRTYDNLVDYSKINIRVSEVKEYTAPEPETYWERVSASFTDGIDSFVRSLGNFFVWFVGAIPGLLLFAVLIIIAIFVINAVNKRRKTKTNKIDAMLKDSLSVKKSDEKKE